MASKLFSAVVGFGIALGTMNAACSADSDGSTTSEAAQISAPDRESPKAPKTETSKTEPAAPAVDAGCDASTPVDPFCETRGWPTTKCGPTPMHSMECVDPKEECGEYPGGLCGNYDDCFFRTTAGACDTTRKAVWKVCKADGDGHGWACPGDTIPRAQCPNTEAIEAAP